MQPPEYISKHFLMRDRRCAQQENGDKAEKCQSRQGDLHKINSKRSPFKGQDKSVNQPDAVTTISEARRSESENTEIRQH